MSPYVTALNSLVPRLSRAWERGYAWNGSVHRASTVPDRVTVFPDASVSLFDPCHARGRLLSGLL